MLDRALAKRWLVFLVTVVAHGLTTRGRALASPDTAHYVQLADGFVRGDFSATFNLGAVRWTKTAYVSLLALARAISPGHWMEIMVGLNVLCSGVIAVLLVEVARRASRSPVAPAVALLLYLGCYEVFLWTPFVLTDPLFAALSFIPFVLMARRILIPDEPQRLGLLVPSLLLAVFSRPPGVVLIPLVLFVELVLVRRRVGRALAMVIIVFAALTALFVRTAAVHDPGQWAFRFIKPKIVEFSEREKTGEVVYDRKETFRPPPRSATDHVVIVGDRFVRFFQFTSRGYSRSHNLVNAAYFIPLYGLALLGIVQAFRAEDRRRRSLVIAILVWIGMFAYLYALTSLDYDWRSRMPVMPHFILLASFGVEVLIGLLPGQRAYDSPSRA
jgi:hypothetical protein